MVLWIKYEDIDNYTELEEDTIVIGLKDEDFDKFIEDFYDFSNYYMEGYNIGDILYEEEDVEEILQEEYPGLSKEDAEYFANIIEERGLSGSSVVLAFLEKYPQYNCDYNGKLNKSIEFNEYHMKIDGEVYEPNLEENEIERE